MAAELADMHPQTLRQYDRLGIVSPSRAPGKSRRYSQRDVNMLREVQRLSQEGVSLEGIKRILQLENQVAALQRRVGELTEELGRRRQAPGLPDLRRRRRRRRRQPGPRPAAPAAVQAVVVWRPRGSEQPIDRCDPACQNGINQAQRGVSSGR